MSVKSKANKTLHSEILVAFCEVRSELDKSRYFDLILLVHVQRAL